MSYVFSFSSRNSAFRFCDAVNDFGGRAKIVNAPRVGGQGCGLAVGCDDYELCRGVLNRGYYGNLRAVYSFDGQTYKSVYSG